MSFIAINAKADVANSKKGKLTPAQHAQLNAWCLSNKTGILDFGSKCEYSNIAVDTASNKATITFKSGYLVICGRLVECEINTTFVMDVPSGSGTQTGYIVARFSLNSTGNEEFKITQIVSPTPLQREDLNTNPYTGVYEFPLYSYTATHTSVTLERTGSYIPDIGGKLEDFITVLTGTGMSGTGTPPLQGYDKSEGTIEDRLDDIDTRLTNLGFKSGSFSTNATTTQTNYLYRQGNYVYGLLKAERNASGGGSWTLTITVPNNFKPSVAMTFKTYAKIRYLAGQTYKTEDSYATITINSNGTVSFVAGIQNGTVIGVDLNVGYSAPPIT